MVLGPILCSYKQGTWHRTVSTRQQVEIKLHKLRTRSKKHGFGFKSSALGFVFRKSLYKRNPGSKTGWCLEKTVQSVELSVQNSFAKATFTMSDNCAISLRYVNLITARETSLNYLLSKLGYSFLTLKLASFLTTDLSIVTICDALSLPLEKWLSIKYQRWPRLTTVHFKCAFQSWAPSVLISESQGKKGHVA